MVEMLNYLHAVCGEEKFVETCVKTTDQSAVKRVKTCQLGLTDWCNSVLALPAGSDGGDPQQSTSQNTDTPAANTALWNRKYTCVYTSNGPAEHEPARWSAQLPCRHSKRKKNAHVAGCPPIKGWSRWGRSLRLNRWKPNLIFGWRLKLNQKLGGGGGSRCWINPLQFTATVSS